LSYRTCEACGAGFHQFGRGRPAKRCPDCRASDRYGSAHRATRAATVEAAVGALCVRCGRTMLPGQSVQLDHDDDDPTKYLGYSHQRCNASAGASRGNAMRAAAYRAAKGLPAPNGINSARVEINPPASEGRCQRTHEELGAAAKVGTPLPCICARRSSRCW
jgi:hypothetical protein